MGNNHKDNTCAELGYLSSECSNGVAFDQGFRHQKALYCEDRESASLQLAVPGGVLPRAVTNDQSHHYPWTHDNMEPSY